VLSLREQEHFLWGALNGSNSLADIDRIFQDRYGLAVPAGGFCEFLQALIEANLVERVGEPAQAPVRRIALSYSRAELSEPAAMEAVRMWDLPREPLTLVLFNPERLLRLAVFLFWPLRHFVWGLIPFAFFAGLILLHNFELYHTEFRRIFLEVAFWPAFFIAELILNVLVRLVQAVVITGFGGAVRRFRMKFFLGWWPRFPIEDATIDALPREARLWVYASTLLARLAVFAIGTTLWGVYRQTDAILATIGLGFGQLGLWTFLFCAFPLVPLDGYRWLTTALGHPQQLGRSLRFLGMRASGRGAPQMMSSSERWGLALFGFGTVLWLGFSVGWIVAALVVAIVERFQGAGFLLLLAQFCAVILYVVLVRRHSKRMNALRDSSHEAMIARRIEAHFAPTLGN
jgi:hypothetical protein